MLNTVLYTTRFINYWLFEHLLRLGLLISKMWCWSGSSRVSLSWKAHLTLTHSPTSALLVTKWVFRRPCTRAGFMGLRPEQSHRAPHFEGPWAYLQVLGLSSMLSCPCFKILTFSYCTWLCKLWRLSCIRHPLAFIS